jgi:hypothetical protein
MAIAAEIRRRIAEIQPVPQKRSDANGEDYFELKQKPFQALRFNCLEARSAS